MPQGGYNKANRCATNHRATDRAAKLVVSTTAHLAKVRPLGLTFFLCNIRISIATEYTEVYPQVLRVK